MLLNQNFSALFIVKAKNRLPVIRKSPSLYVQMEMIGICTTNNFCHLNGCSTVLSPFFVSFNSHTTVGQLIFQLFFV